MPRRAGTPLYPHRLEQRYQRDLLRVVRVAHVLLQDRLGRVLDRLGPGIDERARGDSAATDIREILRVVERVRDLGALREASPDTAELLKLAAAVDAHASAETLRVIALDVTQGGKLTAVLERWAAENASLITSISEQYLDEVAAKAQAAVQSGTLTRDLVREIEGRYGVARSRAELIARDQIGKLNGQITQQRQTSLGIEEFIWSTSKDERVRPSHAALEGRTFRWDDPPIVDGERATPGSPIQCRCVAIPVLPT